MYQVLNLLILTLILLHSVCEGCQWSIEAEQGTTDGTIIPRGGTSNKRTVRLSEGQYIIWRFVTESSCKLKILSVEYTNDGLSDTITLYADGQLVGSLDTRAQSNHGHLWNEPVSSGPIGDKITLSSGDHTIKLAVTKMDEYGVEVDRVTMALISIYTNDLSSSDGLCSESQEPDIIISNNSWSKGEIIGVTTICIACISTIIALIALITNGYYHHKGLRQSESNKSTTRELKEVTTSPSESSKSTTREPKEDTISPSEPNKSTTREPKEDTTSESNETTHLLQGRNEHAH